MRLDLFIVLGIFASVSAGCASSYEPRPDIDSVDSVGVVVAENLTEKLEAEDIIQLYNLTKGEDRLKNSAVGAGSGAAVGIVVGAGAATLIGCTVAVVVAVPCFGMFMAAGAVLGGGTGAAAGVTVDTQETVEVAAVHLYEVEKVLPALKAGYLDRDTFEQRTLSVVRQQRPDIEFVPAVADGDRYRLIGTENIGGGYQNVNLVLSDFRVQLAGKAANDPDVALTLDTRWSLTKYDASTKRNAEWDVLKGAYRSEKYPLSEWLADNGALLMRHVDKGLDASLTGAFSALAPKADEQKGADIFPEDAF